MVALYQFAAWRFIAAIVFSFPSRAENDYMAPVAARTLMGRSGLVVPLLVEIRSRLSGPQETGRNAAKAVMKYRIPIRMLFLVESLESVPQSFQLGLERKPIGAVNIADSHLLFHECSSKSRPVPIERNSEQGPLFNERCNRQTILASEIQEHGGSARFPQPEGNLHRAPDCRGSQSSLLQRVAATWASLRPIAFSWRRPGPAKKATRCAFRHCRPRWFAAAKVLRPDTTELPPSRQSLYALDHFGLGPLALRG